MDEDKNTLLKPEEERREAFKTQARRKKLSLEERLELRDKIISDKLKLVYKITDPNFTYNYFQNTISYNNKAKPTIPILNDYEDENKWITIGIKTSIKIRNKINRKNKNPDLAKYYRRKIKHYINILKTKYYEQLIVDQPDVNKK